jgi:fimbrial isopeptide formation D2 family protein
MNRITAKILRVLFALGFLSLTQLVRLYPSAQAQTAVNLCAVPGKDGVDTGTISVVNSYYPGLVDATGVILNATLSPGDTSIPVGAINSQGNQTTITKGDLLLIIQMQDADIDYSDTAQYGSGSASNNGSGSTSINQTGLYEFVVAQNNVDSAGGTIQIRGAATNGGLINGYRQEPADITSHGRRTYQVVRVPQYLSTNLTLTGVIRSPGPWNGSSGGIVALDVANTLTLDGTIEVQDKGFRGGGGTTNTDTYPDKEDEAYRTDGDVPRGGVKGEGIAGTPLFVFDGTTTTNTSFDGYPRLKSGDTYTTIGNTEGGSRARGAPGNAGGGGNQHNAGGGGGGNGGAGGNGGMSIKAPGNPDTNPRTGVSKPVGGRGGAAFTPAPNRLIMGGGGGAGDANNGVAGSGGLGGGIVIIRAGTINGAGSISARAKDGILTPTDDGGSGAGAGGSILVMAKNGSLSNIKLNANGGKGGDTNTARPIDYDFGPGGGGGGGVIFSSVPIGSATVSGGQPGLSFNGQLGTATTGVTREASAGADGKIVSGLSSTQIPGILSGADCIRSAQGFKSVKLTNDADNTASITPGDTLTWTVSYANNDSKSITNFQIADVLPNQVAIASAGAQTITVNSVQGTVPAKDSSYTGAGNNTLFSSPITLLPGGVVTVSIPVKVNAVTAARTELINQATASGDGLPVEGLKSDNIDQSTSSLPAGVSVPASSILQTQNAASLDPTTAIVVKSQEYLLSPYQGKIVINEVLYSQSAGTSAAENDEFIELYNASADVIDLRGWQLIDGNIIDLNNSNNNGNDNSGSITGRTAPFIFGDPGFITSGTTSLQPGQYAVIWVGSKTPTTQATGATFQAWLGQSVKLNDTGDDVWLYDRQAQIVDYMAFGKSNAINTRPPIANLWDATYEAQLVPTSALGKAQAKGQSLSLTPNGKDGNTSACWEPTTNGEANTLISGAPRCSGFLSTRDTDLVVIGTGITAVNRVTSVGENNNGPSVSSPNVFLVKRITKLNNLSTNPNDGTALGTFVDDSNTAQDNHPNWPSLSGSYLLGAIDGGLVKSSNEVEYTIYFLSSGTATAKSVQICDRIPPHQTFVLDAFNGFTAAPNTTPASSTGDRGIAVFQGSTTNPDTTYGYTNVSDGDAAQYYPPGSTLPSACAQTALAEDNGAIVVNLGNLPNATGPGTPKESYGFLRFRTKVK